MYFKFTKDSEDYLKRKHAELHALVNQLQQPDKKIENIKEQIGKTYNEISLIEMNGERKMNRFSLLGERLSLKISTHKQQVEECLKAKTPFDNFSYSDMNAVDLTSYGLFSLLNVLEGVKDSWEKNFKILKEIFFYYITCLLSLYRGIRFETISCI